MFFSQRDQWVSQQIFSATNLSTGGTLQFHLVSTFVLGFVGARSFNSPPLL